MKKIHLHKMLLLATTILIVPVMLTSCNKGANITGSYPKSAEQRRDERVGSLAGKDGLVLYSGSGTSSGLTTKASKVQTDLLQSALQVVSFMPLASVDSAGGVIITDWYNAKDAPNERFKLNILISKPNNVQVRVFKQILKSGQWHNSPANPNLAKDFEDQINRKASK